MRKRKILLAIALCVLFAFSFIACQSTYTVKFELNGGSAIAGNEAHFSNQSITGGEFASKPQSNPQKRGYDFKFWSTGTTLQSEEFNFTTTAINANTTINAVWEIKTYNISYLYAENEPVENHTNPTTYNVTSNITLTAPTGAENFDGWYTDLDNPESKVTTITDSVGDITLFAKFNEPVGFTVTFYKNVGSTTILGTAFVEDGSTVPQLQIPSTTIGELQFKGWVKENGTSVDLTTLVIEDNIPLYATWEITSSMINGTWAGEGQTTSAYSHRLFVINNETVSFLFIDNLVQTMGESTGAISGLSYVIGGGDYTITYDMDAQQFVCDTIALAPFTTANLEGKSWLIYTFIEPSIDTESEQEEYQNFVWNVMVKDGELVVKIYDPYVNENDIFNGTATPLNGNYTVTTEGNVFLVEFEDETTALLMYNLHTYAIDVIDSDYGMGLTQNLDHTLMIGTWLNEATIEGATEEDDKIYAYDLRLNADKTGRFVVALAGEEYTTVYDKEFNYEVKYNQVHFTADGTDFVFNLNVGDESMWLVSLTTLVVGEQTILDQETNLIRHNTWEAIAGSYTALYFDITEESVTMFMYSIEIQSFEYIMLTMLYLNISLADLDENAEELSLEDIMALVDAKIILGAVGSLDEDTLTITYDYIGRDDGVLVLVYDETTSSFAIESDTLSHLYNNEELVLTQGGSYEPVEKLPAELYGTWTAQDEVQDGGETYPVDYILTIEDYEVMNMLTLEISMMEMPFGSVISSDISFKDDTLKVHYDEYDTELGEMVSATLIFTYIDGVLTLKNSPYSENDVVFTTRPIPVSLDGEWYARSSEYDGITYFFEIYVIDGEVVANFEFAWMGTTPLDNLTFISYENNVLTFTFDEYGSPAELVMLFDEFSQTLTIEMCPMDIPNVVMERTMPQIEIPNYLLGRWDYEDYYFIVNQDGTGAFYDELDLDEDATFVFADGVLTCYYYYGYMEVSFEYTDGQLIAFEDDYNFDGGEEFVKFVDERFVGTWTTTDSDEYLHTVTINEDGTGTWKIEGLGEEEIVEIFALWIDDTLTIYYTVEVPGYPPMDLIEVFEYVDGDLELVEGFMFEAGTTLEIVEETVE